MAGAKISARAKLKDDKGKFLNSNGSGDEPDSSILRRPIQTSITGFAQARKIFDTATEELKDLLTLECDLVYECKVCRNMFRSLANFVSHKRVYCKEKFKSSLHGHFGRATSTPSEIFKIKQLEEGYQEFLRNQKLPPATTKPEATDERVPLSRDLTAVMENLIKHKEVTQVPEETGLEVAMQNIPSSKAAVFQNLITGEDPSDDMRSQITELDKFAAKDKALLREDGKFEVCEVAPPPPQETEPVIHISDDDESQLTCTICDIQFSTRKTLRFHMKYKHVPDRLVYPCTDCCDTFSTSWSVLRHLYRSHRKTLTQMRRMRELVQSRAFRMNNVPSSFAKKNNKKLAEQKLTEEERKGQENQAWMDNMESDSEVPRCGGCGRSFERRAALAAHTYTCQSRTRALARRAAPAQPPPAAAAPAQPPPAAAAPPARAPRDAKTKEKAEGAEKLTIKQMKPSIMEKEVKEVDAGDDVESEEEKPQGREEGGGRSDAEDEKGEARSDAGDESGGGEDEKGERAAAFFPDEVERANMEALRKRVADYADKTGTQCRICKRKYTSPSHLCRHMASHLNWRRYGCRLCNYVSYDRNRLVLHAQNTHRIKVTDDAPLSIVKPLTASEALELSRSPTPVPDYTWDDTQDGSESSRSSPSSDESEGSSRAETARPNRRKQTFNIVKSKCKSSSPFKDEDKTEKVGVKRASQTPIDIIVDHDNRPKKLQSEILSKDRHATKSKDVMSSQRPVRKRTRPKKDEDFEYDFSNLTKWEGGSYKESEPKVTPTSRPIASKRKSQAEATSSETSPEKADKQEKNDKAKDDKPKKQEKAEEQRKRFPGALSIMSHNAVKSSRAHLRPSFTTSLLYIVRQPLPFQLTRAPVPNAAPASKPATEDLGANVMNARFKGFPASEAQEMKAQHTFRSCLVDAEKQIDEENSKKVSSPAFKSTDVQSLLQYRRQSLESKKSHPVQKQKVIVMKRISGDTAQTGSLLKFPSIMFEKAETSTNTAVGQETVQMTAVAINSPLENKSSQGAVSSKDVSHVDKVKDEQVSKDCPSQIPKGSQEIENISNAMIQIPNEVSVEKIPSEGEVGNR